MVINDPETVARARRELAHISYADNIVLAHSCYTYAVGWINALLAEGLIDDDINSQLLQEAAMAKDKRRLTVGTPA